MLHSNRAVLNFLVEDKEMMILKGTKEDGTKVFLGNFNYIVSNATCICAVEYSTDTVVLLNHSDYLQFSVEEIKEKE